jgi:hypothetical protein
MKDKAGPSTAPNGIHAQPNNVQTNGVSKRKNNGFGSSLLNSRPFKKRIAYVDVTDEEDAKASPREINGLAPNGVVGSPTGGNHLRRKKSKGHNERESAKQLSLQEQRQQLPIARGTPKI